MTFASCSCPLPDAITTIDPLVCGENIGQIQKLVIQRRQAAPPFPAFTGGGAGSADILASWTAFKNAVDATKAQTTPFVTGLVIPAVTAIREGADTNETIDGVPDLLGETTPLITGMIRSLPASIRKQLKELVCYNDLTAYFINEFGKIVGQSPSGTDFQGIPIFQLHVGDPSNDGKNTVDKTAFEFALRAGWADDLVFVEPSDFDARNDL